MTEFLVSAKGIDFTDLSDHIQRDYWQVRKLKPKTPEEIEAENNEKNIALLDRLKAVYGSK